MAPASQTRRIVLFSIVLIATELAVASVRAADQVALEQVLSRALESNAEYLSARLQAESEHAGIRAQYALDNPRLGLMREVGMAGMDTSMGPMKSWSIVQDIRFPLKYFSQASAQRSKAEAADLEAQKKGLELRKNVIGTYYSAVSGARILELFHAQREAALQSSRIAEARYATGAASQQDQMKAHVEQTKIETEILFATQERETALAELRVLSGMDEDVPLGVETVSLEVPKLTIADEQIYEVGFMNSPEVKRAQKVTEERSVSRSLAVMGYLPDISISYQRAYAGAPEGAYSFAVELMIPLWFPLRQSSEVRSASLQLQAAEKSAAQADRQAFSQMRALLSRVRATSKSLRLYDTSLLPQTETTLNSSRAAYQTGKVGFIELLDSQRTVYETRIARLRTLVQYAQALAELEQVIGASVSSLPKGGLL